mgnify:CR=1 FL=1
MAYAISRNFTRLWNEIPENAKLFSGNGYKLITYLLRETIGFGRNSVTITKRKISKHTGICMDKVQIYTKELKELELISITHNVGANITYHIVDRDNWTHPHLKEVRGGTPKEVRGLPQKGNDPPAKKDGGSRGAKESIKENFKEKKEKQFLYFKEHFTKHLPKEKWDDENIIREQFLTLNEEEMKFLLLGLEYENNQWRQPDFDRQFIKRASIYLQKREFLRDKIVEPVKVQLFEEEKKRKFIIDNYGTEEEYKKQKAAQNGLDK